MSNQPSSEGGSARNPVARGAPGTAGQRISDNTLSDKTTLVGTDRGESDDEEDSDDSVNSEAEESEEEGGTGTGARAGRGDRATGSGGNDDDSDFVSITDSDNPPPIELGGRHFYGSGTIFIPNDEVEHQRQALVHELYKLILDGNLTVTSLLPPMFMAGSSGRRGTPSPSPPGTSSTSGSGTASLKLNILDVGTGTGRWAMEMARLFPNAKVTGTDVASSQLPARVPANLVFEIEDCLATPWNRARESQDFIYMRNLVGGSLRAAAEWKRAFREAYACLKPGGRIEIVDWRLRWFDYREDMLAEWGRSQRWDSAREGEDEDEGGDGAGEAEETEKEDNDPEAASEAKEMPEPQAASPVKSLSISEAMAQVEALSLPGRDPSSFACAPHAPHAATPASAFRRPGTSASTASTGSFSRGSAARSLSRSRQPDAPATYAGTGAACREFERVFHDFSRKVGIDFDPTPNMPQWLSEMGFEKCVARPEIVPIGPWGNDEKMRLRGAYFRQLLMDDLMEAYCLMLFTRGGWTVEQVRDLLGRVKEETVGDGFHAFAVLVFITARKPLGAQRT